MADFEFQSGYQNLFKTNILRKDMNALIPQVKDQLVQLLFFYKVRFHIKLPTKIIMPLNKEIKQKQ